MTMDELLKELEGFLREHQLLSKHLLCAVSGGADSVLLLQALRRLQERADFELTASHIQHGLRGESSLEDERFVRQMCRQLQVPLDVENAMLTGTMEDAGAETRARDQRRLIFARQMDKFGCDALVLAHHRDDQSETVLMHLLRGSGLQGLCGMQSEASFGNGRVLRPLLGLSKQEILDILQKEGIPHREDESNVCLLTPRNVLRLEWMPQLEKLFPGAGKHLAQTALMMQSDENCLEDLAEKLYQQALHVAAPLFSLKKEPLLNAHPALTGRCLRKWVAEAFRRLDRERDEKNLSFQETQQLDELLHQDKGTMNLPSGLRVTSTRSYLHLDCQNGQTVLRKPEQPEKRIERRQALYCIGQMQIEADWTQTQQIPCDADRVLLSEDILLQGPVLRFPRQGDMMKPLGAKGKKPLRRWMTDRKIDPAIRQSLPVLACGTDILWVPSLCTAEALRIKKGQSGIVCLKVRHDTPKE